MTQTTDHAGRTLLATLDTPFNQPNVRTEGLAVAPDGSLYAFVVFVDRFRKASRLYRITSDEMEGLCVTQEGALFGLCDEERSFLVRLDPQTKEATPVAPFGFGALCLAAPKTMTK